MQSALKFSHIIFWAGIIVGAVILFYLIDNGLGLSWPSNVVRNWEEFGFVGLHGQLVYNTGGYEADSHPQIYKGMSPVFLYPVYLAIKIFGWTGLDTMAFQILLLIAVIWASWRLLGRDHFAMIAVAAAVLSPGYLRWTKFIDPGALSVLPVLPYAAIVLELLKKPKFTAGIAAAILVLTAGFMSLNWTSAWVCGACFFFFLGIPGVNRRSLFFLLAVMVIGIPAIAATSVAAKYGSGAMVAGSSKSEGVLGSYMWGNAGYGYDLTTGRAFIRDIFVNSIGLFPLWLILIYAIAQRVRSDQRISWILFAPLALTVADLIIMRNYFGHHPWMAGPVLMIGVIFSLALLRIPRSREANVPEKIPFKIVPAVGLLCFLYGVAVLMFLRANETQLLSLVQLVRQHTARSDVLVIEKGDAATAQWADRLSEPLDRHIIVVDDAKDLAGETNHDIILSSIELSASFNLAAQSKAPSQSRLSKVIDWFNHTISKRSPGDRLELSETYYLYELKPGFSH